MNDDCRVCVECRAPFVLTEGEIRFYAQHDLAIPRRCASCRARRRAERQQQSDVRYFNRELRQ